ncbi:MAG: hypothetical protein DELT_01687 [Desulfovibrio sp.]
MTQALYVCCEESVLIPPDEADCCDHCDSAVTGKAIDLPDGYTACDADCAASLGYTQCHDCGDWHKTDDSFYDPQGNPVCTDCFDENYRICGDCGETVAADDTHWVERPGKTVCEGCRREHYVLCHDCGQLVRGPDGHYVENHDYYVCPTCRESDYAYCERCGHLFHYDNMDGDYCDECRGSDDDGRIHDYSYTPQYEFHHTYADTAEHKLYFGFELEIEVAACISDACDEVDGFPYLYMKSDSSISHGFEIVSHPGTLNYWHQEEKAIAPLLRQLKALGCNAEPQGLHVHISKGLMQEAHRIRFQSFFDANKELMHKVARRSECGYSKHKDLSHCDWKNAANNSDRYQAVNWQNAKTVEIRMFRGTLKIDEFMASIEFCHAAYQFTKSQVSLATIANGDSWNPFCDFIRHDKRYPALAKYLVDRGIMEGRQCA